MPTPEARAARDRAFQRRIYLGLFLLGLALFSYLLAQSYAGRVAIRKDLIHGCERGRARNLALLEKARADAVGDRAVASDPGQTARTRRARTRDAAVNEHVAHVLRVTNVPCDAAYPKPTFSPGFGALTK